MYLWPMGGDVWPNTVQFSSLQNLLVLNLFLALDDVAWFVSLPFWEHRKFITGQFPHVDSWHKALVIISFYFPPVLKEEQIPTPSLKDTFRSFNPHNCVSRQRDKLMTRRNKPLINFINYKEDKSGVVGVAEISL